MQDAEFVAPRYHENENESLMDWENRQEQQWAMQSVRKCSMLVRNT